MRKTLFFFLPFILLLAACEHPGPPAPGEPNFTRFQPIHIAVANIDIVDEYEPPMKEPNVEHLIPYSPTDAMHIWVKDRLRAVGTDKTLQVIIHNASVIATPMPPTGFFNLNHDKQYDARLTVEMRIYGGSDAMSLASIKVNATRSITIGEKASLAERKALFNKMIHDLMEDLNAQLEKNIYQYFGNYIHYSY